MTEGAMPRDATIFFDKVSPRRDTRSPRSPQRTSCKSISQGIKLLLVRVMNNRHGVSFFWRFFMSLMKMIQPEENSILWFSDFTQRDVEAVYILFTRTQIRNDKF